MLNIPTEISALLPALQGSCPKAMRCCWSTWSIIHDILEYFSVQLSYCN